MISKVKLEGFANGSGALAAEFDTVRRGLADTLHVPCAMGHELYERQTSEPPGSERTFKGRCVIVPDYNARAESVTTFAERHLDFVQAQTS